MVTQSSRRMPIVLKTFTCSSEKIVAELTERSPIIIQNSSNPSSRINLDVRPYDRTTV